MIIVLILLTLILLYIIYQLSNKIKKLENNVVVNYSEKTKKELKVLEKEKEKREKEMR